MKRLLLPLCLALVLALTACTGGTSASSKASIGPYSLTQKEQEVLDAYNITQGSLLSYRAPDTARSIRVNIYHLDETGAWVPDNSPGMGIGDLEEGSGLRGTVTILPREDHSLVITVCSNGGRFSTTAEPPAMTGDPIGTTWTYLDDAQDLSLDQEIPIAMFSDTSNGYMDSLSLADFSSPAALLGPNAVQAITITFSEADL